MEKKMETTILFRVWGLTSEVPELVEKYRQEKLVAEASEHEWGYSGIMEKRMETTVWYIGVI